MKVACLMMQKNEDQLLRPWALYHAALFGKENLFLFDNGSSSGRTLETLRELDAQGFRIDRSLVSKADFERKGDVFRELTNTLRERDHYDMVMPLDCDEFVAVRKPDRSIAYAPCDVIDYLGEFRHVAAPLAIAGSYYNAPGRSDWFFFWEEQKRFFALGNVEAMDKGFHSATVAGVSDAVATRVVHIHLQHKPYEIAKQAAREKLAQRVPNFEPNTMRAYRGDGQHLTKYFLTTEEEYVRSVSASCKIDMKGFEMRLADLGLVPPFAD